MTATNAYLPERCSRHDLDALDACARLGKAVHGLSAIEENILRLLVMEDAASGGTLTRAQLVELKGVGKRKINDITGPRSILRRLRLIDADLAPDPHYLRAWLTTLGVAPQAMGRTTRPISAPLTANAAAEGTVLQPTAVSAVEPPKARWAQAEPRARVSSSLSLPSSATSSPLPTAVTTPSSSSPQASASAPRFIRSVSPPSPVVEPPPPWQPLGGLDLDRQVAAAVKLLERGEERKSINVTEVKRAVLRGLLARGLPLASVERAKDVTISRGTRSFNYVLACLREDEGLRRTWRLIDGDWGEIVDPLPLLPDDESTESLGNEADEAPAGRLESDHDVQDDPTEVEDDAALEQAGIAILATRRTGQA